MALTQLPHGGVVLIAQDADKFYADLDRANKSIKELGERGKEAEKGLQSLDAAATGVGIAMAAIGAAGAAAVKQIVGVAARVEELGVILDVTRQNAARTAEAEGEFARAAALTSEAVEAQVQATKDLGVALPVAQTLLAKMIRYELDWTKASELARIAQDSATYAAQDSSEALEGLIHGITTLQPRVLRTYGIMLNLREAYRDFAEANDLATETMTTAQKQQAVFNEVLAQAPNIAGAYEAAMTTASKQLRSMRRDIIDVSAEFGEALVPAFTDAVNTGRDFFQWLKDLPDPIQATISQVGALGTGVFGLGGAALFAIPNIRRLKDSIINLSIATNLAGSGLLGPAGLVAALGLAGIAAGTYLQNVEKAHRAEAAAILDTSDSYDEYLEALEQAEVGSYALSESLYEVATAADEAGEAIESLALQEAHAEIREGIENLVTFAANWELLPGLMDATGGAAYDLTDAFEDWIAVMSEHQLVVASDEDAIRKLLLAAGVTGDEVDRFIQLIVRAAKEEKAHRTVLESEAAAWERYADALADAADGTDEMIDKQALLNALGGETTDIWRLSASQLERFSDAMVEYRERTEKAIAGAADDMVEADQKAAEQMDRIWDAFQQDRAELAQEWADTFAEISQDILGVDEQLQEDLLALEEEYARRRAEAAEEYTQDILDAERDLAHDIEETWIKLRQKQEDLDREYAQDLVDAERDLSDDLEDLWKDYQRRLEDAERDHQQDMLDLQQEYGEKRAAIIDKYAKKAADIEAKYQVDTGVDIDKEREELLQELRSIQGLYAVGGKNIYRNRRAEIQKRLDELKQLELDALAAQKQAELDALAEWLAKEEAVREEAYQREKDEEKRRYDERVADRKEQYEEELADLKEQLEREREELKRDRARREEDLRRRHEWERQEILRRYDERLKDLEAQQAAEAARLEDQAEKERQRLRDLLEEERDSYAARQAELEAHYEAQKQTIEDELEKEKQSIKDGLEAQLLEILTELSNQSSAFADAYQEQREELESHLFGPGGMLEKWREYQQQLNDLYGVKSPSRWMIDYGRNLTQGFAIGFDTSDTRRKLAQALEEFQEGLGLLAERADVQREVTATQVLGVETRGDAGALALPQLETTAADVAMGLPETDLGTLLDAWDTMVASADLTAAVEADAAELEGAVKATDLTAEVGADTQAVAGALAELDGTALEATVDAEPPDLSGVSSLGLDTTPAEQAYRELTAGLDAVVLGTSQVVPMPSWATSTSSETNYNLNATFPEGYTYAGVRDTFRLMEYSSL